MNKSLIALSVIGACVAPIPAIAEVTLSGAVNFGPVYGDSDDGAVGPTNDIKGVIAPAAQARGQTGSFLHGSYSHFDIESVDDIGGGNKVVVHIQLGIGGTENLPGESDAVRNRNSHVGLIGNWGALRFGTNENVYERFMYEADPLDGAAGVGGNLLILGTPGGAVFESGFAANGPTEFLQCSVSGIPGSGCVEFYRRTEHTIWYISPSFGGFSFEVDYTLPAFKATNPAGATINPQIFSIGGKYKPEAFPITVDLAYERHNDLFGLQAIAGNVNGATATDSSDTGIQVGASYTLGNLSFQARFERLEYELDGMGAADVNQYERDAYWLALKWNLASGYVGAEYGFADEADCERVGTSCSARESGAQLLAAGYWHTLSKQTQVAGVVSVLQNDDFANYVNIGGGGGIGQDSWAAALYFRHFF